VLATSVQRYFQEGLAPSTRRSYEAAIKRFNTFCTKYNIIDPFPVTEYTLCCFTAYLANEGLSPQTGKTYLAGVRNMQLSLGLPDPRDQSSLPILKRVQAGISRVRLRQGTPAKIRLPITAPLLLRIKHHLESSSHPCKLALWAVCCTAFFGFFRLGELLLDAQATFDSSTHLAWGDIAVDNPTNPTMLRVHLKRSKTDQFGTGADIVLGRTDANLCPVAAVLGYIAIRGCQPGPFFTDGSEKPLLKSAFIACRDMQDPGHPRDTPRLICRPQFQDRGRNLRSTRRSCRLHDPTAQSLAKCSLPPLREDSARAVGTAVNRAGSP